MIENKLTESEKAQILDAIHQYLVNAKSPFDYEEFGHWVDDKISQAYYGDEQ